ncbi:MAG: hypothetical protein ABIL09_20540 [Gemmatimonadota bacterium]
MAERGIRRGRALIWKSWQRTGLGVDVGPLRIEVVDEIDGTSTLRFPGRDDEACPSRDEACELGELWLAEVISESLRAGASIRLPWGIEVNVAEREGEDHE